MEKEKQFPKGMVPLGDSEFSFDCHPGVDCFTICCKKVDLILYPYDVLLLARKCDLDTEEFIREHTYLQKGSNPFFPTVKLKLTSEEICPFLNSDGCSVYTNRPSACRTYPLERAVDRKAVSGENSEYYFLTSHEYCHGHNEKRSWKVQSWIRNQQLIEFNVMNSLWAELDTLFAANPWKGEGAAGEKQQIAFMVCYNLDGFKRFCDQYKLLERFKIERAWKRRILKDDIEMMKFGFEWLKLFLTGTSNRLQHRR